MSGTGQETSASKYPNIEAYAGRKWLSIWQGRLTDAELQRHEDHFRELLKSRAHEAECEAAAMALLNERRRRRA